MNCYYVIIFQPVYDPFFISVYNLFYTSLPVLCLGIMDQDVDDFNCRRFPNLYTPGHANLFFNKKQFFYCAVQGAVTSALILFIPYGEFTSTHPLEQKHTRLHAQN